MWPTMARGFDELLEFLLEEIALRGEQGTLRDHPTPNPHREVQKICGESSVSFALPLSCPLLPISRQSR